jgi:hypothetical protein
MSSQERTLLSTESESRRCRSQVARHRPVIVVGLLATVFCASSVAAEPVTEVQAQNAVPAVLAAFDRFPVVALGMSHWQQAEADFALALVRDPNFASTVNDIVIEAGNSRYQAVLDRYIAGQPVALESLQRVWRDTTQPGRGDAPPNRQLLDAVREVNRTLPKARRLRVLAGDSPIRWDEMRTPHDVAPFLARRDADFASVVEREVLAKHRKALLVIGAGHVLRRPISWRSASAPPAPTVTMLLEDKFPGSTFVIMPHDGFGDRRAEFEARFAAWPKPALASLPGTWLGSVSAGTVFAGNVRRVGSDPSQVEDPYPGLALQDLADAFLYLGPLSTIARVEYPAPEPGTAYARELELRHRLMGEMPMRVAAPATTSPGGTRDSAGHAAPHSE